MSAEQKEKQPTHSEMSFISYSQWLIMFMTCEKKKKKLCVIEYLDVLQSLFRAITHSFIIINELIIQLFLYVTFSTFYC